MASEQFMAMTLNERLFALGLLDAFGNAARARDRREMCELLRRANLSAEEAGRTADAILANPVRYGFSGSLDGDVAPTIIEEAELLESPTDPYVRRATFLSADRAVLAVVSKGKQGLYRVDFLQRRKDSYYRGGEGWGSTGDSSVTDTFDAAERLVRGRFEGLGHAR